MDYGKPINNIVVGQESQTDFQALYAQNKATQAKHRKIVI